ncbi:NACHT domain-containing protein [Mastigocoleus testarum]|uniref:NACHT domain-containing protein n=1 Tax=Mastigocoleus testarum BC008 TaxID=371196 RepID=A0A0V7ZJI3_9CYAN|nr:NACHT domain-containing protein [Mastigocoleus testarum]KST64026.1 hypothetical protein BC008_40230 [Mastigocoleus testarum BC008]KST64736.1 hypothetical protein BC008_41205 [Mastigocoleus testarum BC008]
MNQLPPDNSDSQQPSDDSSQKQQADTSRWDNVVQGNQNRVVQGDGNQVIEGDNNQISHTHIYQSQQEASPRPQLTRQEYQNRQALLTKVKKFWVKGVLEKSLRNQVLIEFGLDDRPDAIASSWEVILETEDSSPQPLPEGTKVIDIFDEIGAGRTLLILGKPGSGKTTTLLELSRDLITRAEQDINLLIPVVFNLSSWDKQQKIADKQQTIANWLVEELNSKYDVPKKIGKAWVKQQQLLPLLDGLDEVKAEHRDDCIKALNQFKQNYGVELVVCCRIEDYESLSNRLEFQRAVYLKSLTPEQIYHYLDSVRTNLTGLKALIQWDRVLQELVQSPLMLNIMTLVYQGVAVEDLPKTEVLEERRKQLFDNYIKLMLKRPNRSKVQDKYSQTQTKRWLIWLAQKMVQRSQTVFLIEQMQPTWLKSRAKNFYRLSLGTIFGILFGLINLLAFTWMAGLIHGLIWGGIYLIIGIFAGLFLKEITTVGIIQVNWKIILIPPLKFGVSFGLFMVFFDVLYNLMHQGRLPDLVHMLTFFLKGSLFFGIMLLLQRVLPQIGRNIEYFVIEKTTNPNQGIWKSLQNALMISVSLWTLTGFAVALIARPEEIAMRWFSFSNYGFGAGLVLGGATCIQHFILRFILYINNNIPWNYGRFLDYATERIFLQKVGGGYIFIHRMLMEHFAQMQLESRNLQS